MENIMQHFRPEEQEFITQITRLIGEVHQNYAPKLTSFLDPRQLFIIETLVGNDSEVKMMAEGVFTNAERQRILLYPSYFEPQKDDFSITVYELKYPAKFIQIKHPDVLGSLLAIGLDRSKFGDIRINEQKIQFVVQSEVENFVQINLDSINKVKVHLKELDSAQELLENLEQWKEQQATVSSLRLDTVLATAHKISRQKAAQLIQGAKVKVNYRQQENISFEIHEDDLISVRGFGRLKISSIEGRTKKDKIRVVLKKLEKN